MDRMSDIRQTWNKQGELKATEAVKKKVMGRVEVSHNFNVPRSTFGDYFRRCGR
jgi:hypothetical protein